MQDELNTNNELIIFTNAFMNFVDLLKSQNTINYRLNINLSVNQKGFSEERRISTLAKYDAKSENQKKEEMNILLTSLPKSSGTIINKFFSNNETSTIEHKTAKNGQEYNEITINWKEDEITSITQKLVFGVDYSTNNPFFIGAKEPIYSVVVSDEDKIAILSSLDRIHKIIYDGKIEDFKSYLSEFYQGEDMGGGKDIPEELLISLRDLYKTDLLNIDPPNGKMPGNVEWKSNGKTITLSVGIPISGKEIPIGSNGETMKFSGGVYSREVEFIKKNNLWYMRSSIF